MHQAIFLCMAISVAYYSPASVSAVYSMCSRAGYWHKFHDSIYKLAIQFRCWFNIDYLGCIRCSTRWFFSGQKGFFEVNAMLGDKLFYWHLSVVETPIDWLHGDILHFGKLFCFFQFRIYFARKRCALLKLRTIFDATYYCLKNVIAAFFWISVYNFDWFVPLYIMHSFPNGLNKEQYLNVVGLLPGLATRSLYLGVWSSSVWSITHMVRLNIPARKP